jgi:hypothetical protein
MRVNVTVCEGWVAGVFALFWGLSLKRKGKGKWGVRTRPIFPCTPPARTAGGGELILLNIGSAKRAVWVGKIA